MFIYKSIYIAIIKKLRSFLKHSDTSSWKYNVYNHSIIWLWCFVKVKCYQANFFQISVAYDVD